MTAADSHAARASGWLFQPGGELMNTVLSPHSSGSFFCSFPAISSKSCTSHTVCTFLQTNDCILHLCQGANELNGNAKITNK